MFSDCQGLNRSRNKPPGCRKISHLGNVKIVLLSVSAEDCTGNKQLTRIFIGFWKFGPMINTHSFDKNNFTLP